MGGGVWNGGFGSGIWGVGWLWRWEGGMRRGDEKVGDEEARKRQDRPEKYKDQIARRQGNPWAASAYGAAQRYANLEYGL